MKPTAASPAREASARAAREETNFSDIKGFRTGMGIAK